ncbi:MAG: PfkB family carbohydrate kinase [Candidatus Micrarchaeia archaeon]
MDLFTLGTPVMDIFARCTDAKIRKLGLKKGATNYFSSKELDGIRRKLSGNLFHSYPGDNGRNVCEGFAALGGFCGYQGAIGGDGAGAQFAANLEKCGIANFLSEKKGATGKIIALITPDYERTFCVDLGVSGLCAKEEKLAFSRSRMFFTTTIMLCCGKPVSKLTEKYLKAGRKAGKHVSISIESPPMVAANRAKILFAVRKYADSLFMNDDEAFALLGSGAEKKLARLKPKIPIYLKKGKHGSLLFFKGKQHAISALKAKVIDTTGAGDAYAAGVLYGLSRKYTPQSSAKIGCMLATKVVQKVGAGIPHAHTRIRILHEKVHGRAFSAFVKREAVYKYNGKRRKLR